VRVGERHADLLAPVLETEHLLDPGPAHQVGGPVPPCVDDEAGVAGLEGGERCCVVAGEADDFAAAVAGRGNEVGVLVGRKVSRRPSGPGKAREAVLEDGDVVVGGGHLTRHAGRPGTQRALIGGRLVGAVLAQRCDDHPLAGLAVEPQPRLMSFARGQLPPVGNRFRGMAGQREEQQVAAVGQRPPGRRCRGVSHEHK